MKYLNIKLSKIFISIKRNIEDFLFKFKDFEMFYMKKKFNERLQNEIKKSNKLSRSSVMDCSVCFNLYLFMLMK